MKAILAILMASIMMAAMIAPAMGTGTSATVGNAAPTIVNMSIKDALSNDMTNPSANDLALTPGGTATITVNALVEDLNGHGDISSVVIDSVGAGLVIVETTPVAMTAGATVGATQQWYSATLNVRYYTLPGNYTVTNIATDKGSTPLTDTRTESFDVDATSASVSVADMVYTSVGPGETASGNHVVTNTGNVVVSFSESTTADYNNNDPGDGILWSLMSSTSGTIPATAISTTWGETDTIAVNTNDNVPFSLAVPGGTLPDTYTGTSTFTPQ